MRLTKQAHSAFLPTKAAPLPYPSAPLTVQDMIMRQVNFEDRFLPHLEYDQPEEVMRKEIPTTKWSPAALYVFGINVRRFYALLP